LLDGVAEAEAELAAHSREAIGQLRINVPVTFGLLQNATTTMATTDLLPAGSSGTLLVLLC
jgi:hypothetical protein